jgi:predicted nucleotidyltransferase
MTGDTITVGAIQSALEEIVDRLIQDYQPQQLILFGSLASGDAREGSDIDLLIIKETGETPLERRVRVRRLVSRPDRRVPLSPLVLTPHELAQRLALGDPFYHDIVQRGKVVYDRNGITDPGRLVHAR